MSQLLFKIMAHSYCRHRSQNDFLEDCLGAISGRVVSLNKKISAEVSQIKEVLEEVPTSQEMSIIEEEETERSFTEEKTLSHEELIKTMRKRYNHEANKLQRMEGELDKLINIYKNELLQMSKEMTQWEQKNQDLKKKVKVYSQQNQKLKQEVEDLKDQITNQAADYLTKDLDCGQMFQTKGKSHQKVKQKEEKIGIKDKLMEMEAESVPKKSSFQKVSSGKENTNKQNHSNVDNLFEREKVKKEKESDSMKWRKLSKKIEELKEKLVIYQEEICEKDAQISSLMKKIKLLSGDDEDKRKLKTANTTLRGEKTVLNNQLTTVKKNYAEKMEICELQDMEIRQLKAQIDNFTTTIKWQTETIDELRSSLTKGLAKESQQFQNKVIKLQRSNERLMKALAAQVEQLELINEKTIMIEQNYEAGHGKMASRIAELQSILDQKNECIVRLKTKGTSTESQSAYYTELVKVLTKKVAEKDDIIKRLSLGGH